MLGADTSRLKRWSDNRTQIHRMAVKKESVKTGGTDTAGSSRPFQLLYGIITQDDIVPLSRTEKAKVADPDRDGEHSGDENWTGSDDGSVTETDADLLFSPLNSGDDEEEEDEDEYDNEFLSPVYFGAQYPKRFHHNGANRGVAVEPRKSSVSNVALNELLGINEDFWKDVAMTQEESICYPQQTVSDATELPHKTCSSNEDFAETSFDEFITEDFGTSVSMDASSANWDQDHKIKLLCYRDSKGNFRLRTEDESRVGRSTPSKSCVTKKSLKKHNKNKTKKLLKRAIRRKSGVWEMVNTGIGIGEFML